MKEKLQQVGRGFFPIATSFLVVWMLLRIYEWISVTDRVHPADRLALAQLAAWPLDLAAGMAIAWILFVFYVLISFLSNRWASRLTRIVFAITLLSAFAAIEYFVTTLIPISADLFGYTTEDIITTVQSSGGLSFVALLCTLLTFVLFVGINTLVNDREFFAETPAFVTAIFFVVGLGTAVYSFQPAPEKFQDPLDYYMAVNKLDFFLTRSSEFLSSQPSTSKFGENDYPMLHPVDYADPLGKYLPAPASAPNIVIIVVEGLGRDFVGADAPYGGFTPFLDSLSGVSLYWKNALSNGGRTFAAPPAILGALPNGTSGFMNLGNAMPDHQTLISLLKPYGYTANFFYGGNPNFDNLDLFLERQGLDKFLNEASFPPGYADSHPHSSWGFQDRDMFDVAMSMQTEAKSPRLDMYLTVSTHEPFKCPDSAIARQARVRVKSLAKTPNGPAYQAYSNIFECLLYTDDAIRRLMKAYARRPDYERTVFIITGDHRLIPLPPKSPLERFHVPLIVYSPKLSRPRTFPALAVHANITPTLLGYLHHGFGYDFPERMPFIAGPLNTDSTYTSQLDLALVRNKNEIKEYIQGEYLRSDDWVFKINPDLSLTAVSDRGLNSKLRERMTDFNARSLFALQTNHLDQVKKSAPAVTYPLSKSEQLFIKEQVGGLVPDMQFKLAQQLAFDKQYRKSRIIVKRLINESPNFHDARLLMARTYGWEGNYDSANLLVNQVLARAPMYVDAYSARSDFEYWQGLTRQSLATAEEGLKADVNNIDLLDRQARALIDLKEGGKARKILDQVLKRTPSDEMALQLKQRISNP